MGGTDVLVAGTTLASAAASDGSFSVAGVPDGMYTLELSKGEYWESIPNVLSLPGGEGFLIDGSLYPLGTVELQRGRRLVTSATSSGTVISRDGSHMLVCDSARQTAAVVSLSGTGTLALAECPAAAQFSPDASTLFYTGPDRINIDALMLGDGSVRPVFAGSLQDAPDFVIAPDGAHLGVYVRTQTGTDLWTVSTVDGALAHLAANADDAIFSPDGSLVAFHGPGSGAGVLRVAPVGGGTIVDIGTNYPGGAAFTADGARIVYSSPLNSLYVFSVNGAIITGANNVVWWGLTPDGKRVVFLEGSNSSGALKSMRLSDFVTVTLDGSVNATVHPRMSAAGTAVLYDCSAVTPAVCSAPPDGTATPVRFPGAGLATVADDHAGERIAFQRSDTRDLRVGVLATGAVTVLTQVNGPAASGDAAVPKFSPNDTYLALVADYQNGRGTLSFIPATGGTLTRAVSGMTSSGWTDASALWAWKHAPQPPYTFQAGLYVAPVP